MNYQKIYDQIVERGRQRLLEGYGENHHIIPKCTGGADTQDNIVRLTAREHFICHLLLIELNPSNTKLSYAAYCMANTRDVKVGARTYQILRKAHSKATTARMLGVPKSEETKRRISETKKGKPSHSRTPEMKEKASKTLKEAYRTGKRKSNAGKIMPKSFGEAISKAKKGMVGTNLGISMKEEQKKKISETLKGHEVKQSTRDKIAQTLKNKPELTCPHCNKSSRGSAFKFYHFGSCKFKK
tara:strand:- start:262 stop:987 length:726 start_codon:yes stop_codon:yes gene_type:complete